MDRSPGFIDIQVNGFAGVDFNQDNLSREDLCRACIRLRQDGVEQAFATIITADADAMERRIRAIAEHRQADPAIAQVISGIHVEGPFISAKSGYVGAHPAAAIRAATLDVAGRLIDAGEGLVRLLTLAPECDPQCTVIRWLVRRGVLVSAGHCDSTVDELKRAIDAGLSMFTHLGNGCPLVMHRHDNIIQRTLSLADRLWISFIADGVHVAWPALKNYLSLAGVERAIVVTDATAASGCGPGVYRLGGQELFVDATGATWSPDRSHLMGSAATMSQMAENLKTRLGLSDDAMRRLTLENPAAAIREKLRP